MIRTVHSGPHTVCLLALLALAAFSGCQFNRSFFQMDSNSRVPFFGFDLLPRKQSSSPPSVNRYQNDPIAEHARVSTPNEVAPQPSRVSIRWPRPFSKPQPASVPLPVGNLSPAETSGAPVEQFL